MYLCTKALHKWSRKKKDCRKLRVTLTHIIFNPYMDGHMYLSPSSRMVTVDVATFPATTPRGSLNVSVKLSSPPGTSSSIIVISTHTLFSVNFTVWLTISKSLPSVICR